MDVCLIGWVGGWASGEMPVEPPVTKSTMAPTSMATAPRCVGSRQAGRREAETNRQAGHFCDAWARLLATRMEVVVVAVGSQPGEPTLAVAHAVKGDTVGVPFLARHRRSVAAGSEVKPLADDVADAACAPCWLWCRGGC